MDFDEWRRAANHAETVVLEWEQLDMSERRDAVVALLDLGYELADIARLAGVSVEEAAAARNFDPDDPGVE